MKISILQWNIWCNEDVKNIVNFLKQNNADVICLQELSINYPEQSVANAAEYIAKQLNYRTYYKELPVESSADGNLALADGIFSRFPIIDSQFYLTNNPKTASGYSNEKRVYVEIDLRIGHNKLKIGTTHMSYTHKFEITNQKQQETDKLIKFIAKNKSNYIITGDFNAVPGSYTIDKFSAKYQNLGPAFDAKTWTTKPFDYNGFIETELNWRLDYMFGTKDINLIKTQILKTTYSDHLPILTTIDI